MNVAYRLRLLLALSLSALVCAAQSSSRPPLVESEHAGQQSHPDESSVPNASDTVRGQEELRKGAALNAVQIAEALVAEGLLVGARA